MDESLAWRDQAGADLAAAELLFSSQDMARCHAVAKYQQAVEKAVKAIVASLAEAGFAGFRIGYNHPIEHFISAILRLRRSEDTGSVLSRFGRLFDSATRQGVRSLMDLAPRRPEPGRPPRRNTEYPFHDDAGKWTCPAAQGVFPAEEVERHRILARRIVGEAHRIVSALRRRPR